MSLDKSNRQCPRSFRVLFADEHRAWGTEFPDNSVAIRWESRGHQAYASLEAFQRRWPQLDIQWYR